MKLARDYYRALEDIVGDENISEDPAIVDCYAFQPFGASKVGLRFLRQPPVIILPGSAKEVQAIIKTCRRFGIKFRAHGTGYGNHNAPGTDDTVIMDMRRMNRILELDEKNMTIVVEPYVSFAQAQSEAMKVGLNCNVLGAGCQTSMVASYCAMHGNNSQAVSQSTSPRNILGMEWITPTGEMIRVGSMGSGSGWFSCEGIGPSLRGAIRGSVGTMGGLGVFTACAAHLHPWHGPTKIDVNGVSPYYEIDIPSHFEYHICEFETWQDFADGMRMVGEAGIAFALHKTGGPGSHGHCVTGNNNEYYEKKMAGELDVPIISFTIVMQALSAEEHDWNEKVLHQILEETNGKICPLGEDPVWKKRDLLTMIKACFIPRLAFRPSGMFDVDGFVGMETCDHIGLGLGLDNEHLKNMKKTGCIVDDGTNNSWAVTYEDSHFALFECGAQFSSIDMDSANTFIKQVDKGVEIVDSVPLNTSWAPFGPMAVGVGSTMYNFHLYLRKMKKAFDPDDTCDSSFYVTEKGTTQNVF